MSLPKGGLPKQLPAVGVQFGLEFRTKLTDAGLKDLKQLKNLTWLVLERTEVTDLGMKELKELKDLRSLYLWEAWVTDKGVKELKELKKLTSLELLQTQMTDAGLKDLTELKDSLLPFAWKQARDRRRTEALEGAKEPHFA